MANVHNSKAKKDQRCKKMEEKKVLPLGLAGIRTQDLLIMRPTLYQLSYSGREEIWAKNSWIWTYYTRENEPNFNNFTK